MAKIKLENYINHGLEMDLSREEEIALLYSPDVFEKSQPDETTGKLQ